MGDPLLFIWMRTGGIPYDGKTGFIWASPTFKVIRAFERLIILIILIIAKASRVQTFDFVNYPNYPNYPN